MEGLRLKFIIWFDEVVAQAEQNAIHDISVLWIGFASIYVLFDKFPGGEEFYAKMIKIDEQQWKTMKSSNKLWKSMRR